MVMEFDCRPLATLHEFQAAVALQEQVWGSGFGERVPTSILKVVGQRLGGVASGAFTDTGQLVGFVFGITGPERGVPVHWSDMLAVHPEFRGRGIGRALKLHQREQVHALGVRTMYWTVDPLEPGNAHLNLNVLGATGVEYHEDFYGTSHSTLHGGLPTDRLVLSWEWDESLIVLRHAPPAAAGAAVTLLHAIPSDATQPGPVPQLSADTRLGLHAGAMARIAIPARSPTRSGLPAGYGLTWRHAVRQVLGGLLGDRAIRLTAIEPDPDGQVSWLIVSRTESAGTESASSHGSTSKAVERS